MSPLMGDPMLSKSQPFNRLTHSSKSKQASPPVLLLLLFAHARQTPHSRAGEPLAPYLVRPHGLFFSISSGWSNPHVGSRKGWTLAASVRVPPFPSSLFAGFHLPADFLPFLWQRPIAFHWGFGLSCGSGLSLEKFLPLISSFCPHAASNLRRGAFALE